MAGRMGAAAHVRVGGFDVHFAGGTADRRLEYGLRYQAFVLERGWEAPNASGLERDRWDACALGVLLTDAGTGRAAACQRLIVPDWLPGGEHTNVEVHCRPLAGVDAPRIDLLPRHGWAEASRLTIAPDYRLGARLAARDAMRTIVYATLAGALALRRAMLFTLSDVRTARLTRLARVTMHQVGAIVPFHGDRATYRIDIAETEATLRARWRRDVERMVAAAARVVSGRVEQPDAA